MEKQTFDKIKKKLVIFVVLFVVISMTAATVSAAKHVVRPDYHHRPLAPYYYGHYYPNCGGV